MVPEGIAALIQILLFPGFLFLIALAFFYEWVDRKLLAKLQNRYGPLYTGPSGLLQPFADFIKLLSKEDITPKAADKFMFSCAPLFSIVPRPCRRFKSPHQLRGRPNFSDVFIHLDSSHHFHRWLELSKQV